MLAEVNQIMARFDHNWRGWATTASADSRSSSPMGEKMPPIISGVRGESANPGTCEEMASNCSTMALSWAIAALAGTLKSSEFIGVKSTLGAQNRDEWIVNRIVKREARLDLTDAQGDRDKKMRQEGTLA